VTKLGRTQDKCVKQSRPLYRFFFVVTQIHENRVVNILDNYFALRFRRIKLPAVYV